MEVSVLGVVSSYDSLSGIGKILSDSAGSFGFQCTQLDDGSREIEVGQPVCFEVVPAGPGGWEAGSISKLDMPS